MAKPRIALWYNVASGGSKRQIWYHTRGLIERGYSVTAFRPPIPQSDYLPISGLVEEIEVPLERPTIQKRPFPAILKEIGSIQDRRIGAMKAHAVEIGKLTAGFDVLFANTCGDFHMPMVGRYASIPNFAYVNEPARYLYEALDQNIWALPFEDPTKPLKVRLRDRTVDQLETRGRRILVREERLSALKFNRLLSNSKYSRESMLRAYGVDSRVCYLGIDTELFECRNVEREPFVIGVSSLLPPKNVELAVRAVGAAKKVSRLTWIYNVGDPAYVDQIMRVAQEVGVTLELRSMVSDATLVDLLNRATCMIYAPHLEPFGFAPLEAAACGTPVVAVPEAGVRETVIDGLNGLLGQREAAELGALVDRLFEDSALARRLGLGGAEWVRREWTIAQATDRLVSEIGAVL